MIRPVVMGKTSANTSRRGALADLTGSASGDGVLNNRELSQFRELVASAISSEGLFQAAAILSASVATLNSGAHTSRATVVQRLSRLFAQEMVRVGEQFSNAVRRQRIIISADGSDAVDEHEARAVNGTGSRFFACRNRELKAIAR